MRRFITCASVCLLMAVSASTTLAADRRDLELCGDRQRPDVALRACNRIVGDPRETNEGRAQAFNDRGIIYYQNDDADRAMADFDAAVRLNPRHAMAFNNRGNVHKMKGDAQRAIADYSEAIRLERTNAMAFRNRGVLYAGIDHGRALADFNEAVWLDPKNAYGLLWRGVVHATMGNKDLAEADWDEATRLDPQGAEAFFKMISRATRVIGQHAN
jgi:tetratricopeptide (TPR) repeat protein